MSSKVTRRGEVISLDIRRTISVRYHTITKAINEEFGGSVSDTMHSFYVGSYGRGTAIDSSDIDMLVELPEGEYNRYDIQKGNGQSRFLQAVKNAIVSAYPRSNVKADGQVVVIDFTDGIKFEILPAFSNTDYYGDVLIHILTLTWEEIGNQLILKRSKKLCKRRILIQMDYCMIHANTLDI